MNYADIKEIDIQDGLGVRVGVYVSGCHFHCKGCHNKEAWDFNYGKEYNEETENHIMNLLNRDYIAGLSLLGGEPLEKINQKELYPLVKKVKETYRNKNIWCYTGYNFETDILPELLNENCDPTLKGTFDNIDVLVDGEFIEEQKSKMLKFRGSSNQRIIDVPKSISEKRVVLYDRVV